MQRTNVITKKDLTFSACPACNELNALKKSHSRSAAEKFINRTGIYHTFRCKNCGWRGYRMTLTMRNNSFKMFSIYILLLILSIFITYHLLKLVY